MKNSTQAKAAKQLKSELRKAFPDTKFSVKSDSFAGGDAVRVSYTDGPTGDAVRAIADKYQYGSFDGMRDLYEYDNGRDDIPQTKYVSVSRQKSEPTKRSIRGVIVDAFGIDENVNDWDFLPELGNADLNQKIHRVFVRLDFTGDEISQYDFEQLVKAKI